MEKTYQHLSLSERIELYRMRKADYSMRAIA
ncbi:MAG: helix-turn-helix domain-containing protein, partial [Betaproteobacteria bacterium]|nr:helix-turn-helix domain-containing protein [Betaproteobacteria bacterium]